MSDAEKETEEHRDLVVRARGGDLSEFSDLMEAIQPRLLAQAIAFSRNTDSAKDLVQETMIAAWTSFSRFDASCQLFTWLYVIMLRQHRRSIGWFTRRIPLATAEQIDAASRVGWDGEPGDSSPGADEAELLRAVVSSLSARHQDVVRLRFYAGATEAEIAAALGISPGTVKSRLHHALKKLRHMKEKVNLLREAAH